MAFQVNPYVISSELPYRQSDRAIRAAHRDTVRFFEDTAKDDFDWIKTSQVDHSVRSYISRELDASCLRVCKECVDQLQIQTEHHNSYRILASAPPNCKGSSIAKSLLRDVPPFEQMVALGHWIQETGAKLTKGVRTLCLASPNDYVPVYMYKTQRAKLTLMTVKLGDGNGGHKAPGYLELAENEGLAEVSVFKDPLDALEIVRQPHFAASTLIKAGSFARRHIGARRRYETRDENEASRISQFSCVELVDQKNSKNSPTKEASAGTNLYSLLKHHRNKIINKGLLFEEFTHEGYSDASCVNITPFKLWEATKRSICQADSTQLDGLMEALFISHIGSFSSSVVSDYYSKRIFIKD